MVDDLRHGEEAEEWRQWMNKVQDFEEVTEQMRLMRHRARMVLDWRFCGMVVVLFWMK